MVNESHGKRANSWWTTVTPTTGPTGTAATWVGVTLAFTAALRVAGFRCYRDSGDTTDHVALLWHASSGTPVAATVFKEGTQGAAGWNQVWLRPWFRPIVNDDYRLAILYPAGKLFRINNQLNAGAITRSHIEFGNSFQSTAIAPYNVGVTTNVNANAVDVLTYDG